MLEISSSGSGPRGWKEEVLEGGGPEDAPPDGWLVLVYFYTTWSSDCTKITPDLIELMALYEGRLTMWSLRADRPALTKVSRGLNIKKFPTFVIFRGSVEVARIEGSEKAIEKVL